MNIFVLNCGSSSVKYKLFDMSAGAGRVLAQGRVERVGTEDAIVRYTHRDMSFETVRPVFDHESAIRLCIGLLGGEAGDGSEPVPVTAVGHRVVHGGERFRDAVLVTPEVKEALRELNDLAPLHNPHNLTGIEVAESLLPHAPQVAVFDTGLHADMPAHAYLYGIPYELYERHRIRRYGFHGISHKYAARRTAHLMGRPLQELRIISCHLGGGCSVAAILHGKSVDTSMGFTPLEGLMMGTRSGDIDAGAVVYLMAHEDLSLSELNGLLNRKSGLLGISGLSADMRDIEAAMVQGHPRARLAFDMFEYRVRKYIGAYTAVMNGVDAIAFTAGIGERSAMVRSRLCQGLAYLGVRLDEEKNRAVTGEADISAPGSAVKVFVIPADEERVIAQDTVELLTASGAVPPGSGDLVSSPS
ncbi:MAG: acetate kinase [Firmicutes bacterium]|nr:acetate kinase [Bacillota bacterium]